jgi:hypothetical protein
MNQENTSLYSRLDAILDDDLLDVTETAKQFGFEHPVTLTRAVWDAFVVPAGDERQRRAERIEILLKVLSDVASRGDVYSFRLCERNDNRDLTPSLWLKAIWGPDDDDRPCVTVMLFEEDRPVDD